MAQPVVVAFLSAGRCGTQWLAVGLDQLYADVAVEHEPLGPLYRPRQYFRRYADPEAILEVPEVARHVERIEQCGRPYVETGWPLFPALPLMAQRFGPRLRIVHLTRHPVPSALSQAAHQCYAGSPREDDFTRLATLSPRDPGVFGGEYADRWERLTPYEKCLFWWTEVHQFAIELPQRFPQVPFLRLKSEAMLSGDSAPLQQLLEFIGLDWDKRWLELVTRRIDRWPFRTDEPLDPLEVHHHPRTLDVAHSLGYDMGGLDLRALRRRYGVPPLPTRAKTWVTIRLRRH